VGEGRLMATVAIVMDDTQVRPFFERMIALGEDASGPMRTVSLLMDQKVRDTFRDQSDPWGSPWPPHAPSTVNARARKGNTSAQKLIDTGDMYASLSHSSDASSATVSMAGPAEVHQDGTLNAGRGHSTRIPPRPMFPDDDDREAPDAWWDDVTLPLVQAMEQA
jgi:phage gpG-like protein